jgi:hypothetical protein
MVAIVHTMSLSTVLMIKKSLNSFSQVNWNGNGFNAVCHSVTWNVHLAMMMYKCTIKVEAVKH